MIIIKRRCLSNHPLDDLQRNPQQWMLIASVWSPTRLRIFRGSVQLLLPSDNICRSGSSRWLINPSRKGIRRYLRSPRCRNGVRDKLTALDSLWPTFKSKSLGLTGAGVTSLASRLGFNPLNAFSLFHTHPIMLWLWQSSLLRWC